MADSFFGFDTSLPPEDELSGLEDDELEYDALNDETFGSAINSDWEGIHENLVKLEEDGEFGKKKNKSAAKSPLHGFSSFKNKFGADLDINLSRVSLDDCFVGNTDEHELPLKLDSSVWSSPVDHRRRDDPYNVLSRPDASKAPKQPLLNSNVCHSPLPKMFTVEDIERNIIKAQAHSVTPRPGGSEALGAPLYYSTEGKSPIQPPSQMTSRPPILPPPGLLPSPLAQSQVPLFNVPPMGKQQPPPFRPPGVDFPPLMHLMTSMGAPPMPPRPMPPANMSQMAYNNLAMHSNFRPPPSMQAQPGRLNPLINGPPPPFAGPPPGQMPVNANQYNKRLVQEIQQNHPMLYFNRLNNFDAVNQAYHQQSNQMNGNNKNNNQQQPQRFKQMTQPHKDGNPNSEEFDDYANLMSQRNKQWLIGIQLLQLNTETPFIDDFYYTVFKERKMKRERESRAHRDNQMNHPLTQPKGHAQQLTLMSMAKNGTNQRTHDRDKKNQDVNKGEKEPTPRTYTPLQFENSLGKLQCGSVTAPRKIIDMEVMGTDPGHQLGANIELSTQRKSRQLLLHIESLYKIVLKIEDLKNPIAIATAVVVKAKKERERKQALEQLDVEGAADGEEKSRQSVFETFEEKYPEPEKLDDLIPQLVAGFSVEKVMAMMNVRKGKTLIKRALPHLVDEEHKWQVWQAIFAILPIVVKKDRDDSDGTLAALFPEFKNHLILAKLSDIITVPKAILTANKKLNYIFANKFGMLSIIAMMLRVETIFQMDEASSNDGAVWGQFLIALAGCAAKQQVPAAGNEETLDREVLQILHNHMKRFSEIDLQPLTAVLSQVDFK
ncbi:hypothetical protein DMENIID0001_025560 [Sergentomyia squamirostris]